MEMENKSEQTYIVLFFASLMYSKMEITTFFKKQTWRSANARPNKYISKDL